MKRKEAHEAAFKALGAVPLVPYRERAYRPVEDAILAAYRRGEENMRGQAAEVAELYRRTSAYGSADATNMAANIGLDIRALPLTEEPSNDQDAQESQHGFLKGREGHGDAYQRGWEACLDDIQKANLEREERKDGSRPPN